MQNRKLQIGLTALAVLLIGTVIYLSIQAVQPPKLTDLGDDESKAKEPRDPIVSPRTDGVIDPESGNVIAGGVERPASDLAAPDKEPDADTEVADLFDYGTTPAVPIDANEQTLAVAQAVKTGAYPERLSVSVASDTARNFQPGKFSPQSDAYDEDYRKAYLASPEPGRVWFPAQPAEGVERIQPLMPKFVKAGQGEGVALRVSGVPGQPVTFTSFDLGMFDNKLTTITVVADDQGVAAVTFTGTPGTVDDVNIMAASPVMSGQVRLTVHINNPNG